MGNSWTGNLPWHEDYQGRPGEKFYHRWPTTDAVEYLDQAVKRLLQGDEIPMGRYFIVTDTGNEVCLLCTSPTLVASLEVTALLPVARANANPHNRHGHWR